MRKSLSIFEFLNDLKDLYCRTKISGVERSWIKVSQAYEQAFGQWLESNQDIRNDLNNPQVYDAFIVLKNLRERYPSFDNKLALQLFTQGVGKKSPFMTASPWISDLGNFLGDSDVESILYPFRDIITSFSFIKPADSSHVPNKDLIKDDLMTIRDGYMEAIQADEGGTGEDEYGDFQRGKSTVSQKRIQMFSYLLRRFSEDLAMAASRSGMDDLASAFRSGILANPTALAQKAPMMDINPYMVNGVNGIVKDVMRSVQPEDQDANYNYIKEKALRFVGAVSPRQVQDVYKRREEGYGMQSFMDENASKMPSVSDSPTLSVEDATWLTPEVLTILSVTFAVYYSLLKTRSR